MMVIRSWSIDGARFELQVAGDVARLGVRVAIGHGPVLPELLSWICNQVGFAAIAALLLATVVRRPAR